jgi:hypothetical protein
VRWDDARRLAAAASEAEKQFAHVLAELNGEAQAVKWMVGAGADVNRPSAGLYAHGTPLHHAVCSGSPATVQALVEAGADPSKRNTARNGTPLVTHVGMCVADGHTERTRQLRWLHLPLEQLASWRRLIGLPPMF